MDISHEEMKKIVNMIFENNYWELQEGTGWNRILTPQVFCTSVTYLDMNYEINEKNELDHTWILNRTTILDPQSHGKHGIIEKCSDSRHLMFKLQVYLT